MKRRVMNPDIWIKSQCDIQAIDSATSDLQLALELLRQRCDVLRRTAQELRTGKIHPAHAANRMDKVLDEIYGGKPAVKTERNRR